jgi:hypothetical protein
VSRDIPDNVGTLSGAFLGLVGLGRVDGELGEEFAAVVDDADVTDRHVRGTVGRSAAVRVGGLASVVR